MSTTGKALDRDRQDLDDRLQKLVRQWTLCLPGHAVSPHAYFGNRLADVLASPEAGPWLEEAVLHLAAAWSTEPLPDGCPPGARAFASALRKAVSGG